MAHPFSEAEFKDIFSRVPRLCVDLVVRTPEGVVLTLRSLPTWNGLWHTPGGTVFYKESVVDAVHRVAQDEIGVKVTILKMLGYMEFQSEENERGYGFSVSITFLCEIASGTFLEKTSEASEIRAFTEVPEKMIPEQKTFLTEHWEEILG